MRSRCHSLGASARERTPAMEGRISDADTPRKSVEGDTSVLDELKLKEVIENGSLDFDEWTSLISEIEKTCPDKLEWLCLVYDCFLSEFPLCYGYWKKYADHMVRLCTVDKVVEIFERAVQSATYSVDVWVHYCRFGSLVFEDPSHVCRLFKRALSFVGRDYLCYKLWDAYIEFEFSQQHWSSLCEIYVQTLKFPTKKLRCYYDSFKKLVGIWEEEMKSHSNSTLEQSNDLELDSAVLASCKPDDICCIIKDLVDPSIGLDRSKARQKYVSIGEQFYQEALQLNENINGFEMCIRRSYFHPKPLDFNQLENWHRYLDFAELHADFDWVVKLYERCLIPCANYPEFWMRYVEYMEIKGGREIANFALDRATTTFLKRASVIHLFKARFKEHIGDVPGARAAFLQFDAESDSDFVEIVVRKANMERRLGNFIKASNTINEALQLAVATDKLHLLPTLYIHFSQIKYMTTGNEDAARDILVDGIKQVPQCRLLVEELIKFCTKHKGARHINVLERIIYSSITPDQTASKGWSMEDREEISRLYLQFVDLCGTVHDVQKAWNQHFRLFPHSLRTASLPGKGTKQWKIALGAQKETTVSPHQPCGDDNSDHITGSLFEDKKLSPPENQNAQAAHPGTDKLLNEKKSAAENDTLLPDQAPDNLIQSKEYNNNVQESKRQLSFQVSEIPGDDSITKETEGAIASPELSKESNVVQEYNHDPEQDLKAPSLERLPLDPQETKSPGPAGRSSFDTRVLQEIHSYPPTSRSHDHEASQENSLSNGSMAEGGQNANSDHVLSSPVSTRTVSSVPINFETASPSSSATDQNIMARGFAQQNMPSNSDRSRYQKNNLDRIHRDHKFGFRRNSHKRSNHHRRGSPPRQNQSAEVVSKMPTGQGYPSQTSSSWNSQFQHANPNAIQPQASLMQNVQQQNLSSAYQGQPPMYPSTFPQAQVSQYPMQSNDQHGNVQNNQTYNQMWQYYYYQQQQQQQQFLWQQQQPQQQQLLQQQYQQQLLQMPFFQQQLQQQPEQQGQPQQQQQQQLMQQQLFQQQQLLYLQQQQQLQVQQLQQQQPLQVLEQQHHHQHQTSPPQQQQHEQEQKQVEQPPKIQHEDASQLARSSQS